MSRRWVPRRRTFIRSTILAGLWSGLSGCLTRAGVTEAADGGPPAGFAVLASFLTGTRDLDQRMVARAWTGLSRGDPGFAERLLELRAVIARGKFADVDAFAASPISRQSEPAATAMAIVAAFYTGRVRTGRDTFVGYEDALMYRPTLATTTVPTYASGGAGWWATKPGKAYGDA